MYENERLGGEKTCMPAPNGSMTDLLRETSCIATDVLVMSCKINGHLFGIGNSTGEEKEAEPRCFQDELAKQKSTLLKAAEELSKMCEKFGI